MKATNTPTQSFSDRQPKAIVKVVAICIAVILALTISGIAYMQHNKVKVSSESYTINDAAIAKGISKEVMEYVDEQLETITDENGNQITLDDKEFEALQTLVTSEIVSLLKDTDMLSLNDAQMQSLVNNIKKNVIDNVLKQADISKYFTDQDYENIAKYITESATTDLGNLQKQIKDNKAANDAKNQSQDNTINDLKASITDVKSTITNNEKSGNNDTNTIKNDITNINSSINDTNNNLTTAKEQLTTLIKNNSALDEATKDELLEKINSSSAKSAEDLAALCDELTTSLNTLSISSASSIEELNISLNTAINENAALSKEEREKLLAIVETNKSSTDSSIADLASDLTDAVDELSSLSEEQKQVLLAQIGALKTSTAKDLDTLNTTINTTITELDEKYANCYVATGDINTDGTTTITNSNIHEYSNINIVYESTAGYTVEYTLIEGKLIITGKKNANSTVSNTVAATIYIDNSAVNAQ